MHQWFSQGPYKARSVPALSTQELVGAFMEWNYWTYVFPFLQFFFSNRFNLYNLVSDTVVEFQGLTIVRVSQNQAAVVSDPQNHVFVIKNAGFVAYAIEGTYNVLSIVDQTHLPTIIKDKLTGITLGSTHEVKMKSKVGEGVEKEYVVATLLVSCLFNIHVMTTLIICSVA